MGLSSDLISQFVKVTNDTKTTKKEVVLYGTIRKYNDTNYVQLDGSDLLTPYDAATDAKDGDRVLVSIKNHTVTATGNMTSPSASISTVNQAKDDLNDEFETLKAESVTTEELAATNAKIEELESKQITTEELDAKYATIDNLSATNAVIQQLDTDLKGKIDRYEKHFTFTENELGVGIGKVAELDNVLDIGYQTRLNAGLLYPVIQSGMDLNNIMTPGFYTLKSIQSTDYTNCPPVTESATLIVESCGEVGQIRQIVTNCNKTNPVRYERYFYQDEWGNWLKTNDIGGKILWSGGSLMNSDQYATLAEPISKQLNGVLLIFSRYTDLTVHDYNFTTHFVSKAHVAAHPDCGHVFMMTTDGIFDVFAAKYLYISDTGFRGHANNTMSGTGASGIKYVNSDFVLRYVIGV